MEPAHQQHFTLKVVHVPLVQRWLMCKLVKRILLLARPLLVKLVSSLMVKVVVVRAWRQIVLLVHRVPPYVKHALVTITPIMLAFANHVHHKLM